METLTVSYIPVLYLYRKYSDLRLDYSVLQKPLAVVVLSVLVLSTHTGTIKNIKACCINIPLTIYRYVYPRDRYVSVHIANTVEYRCMYCTGRQVWANWVLNEYRVECTGAVRLTYPGLVLEYP